MGFLFSICNKQIQKKVKISLNCKCFCGKLYGFPSSLSSLLIQIYNNHKLSFGDVTLILVMESKVSWYLRGSCYSIFSFMCLLFISLFVILSVFFWSLCCLFFSDLRPLIIHLVSSNSSYKIDKKICLWTYLSHWIEIINKLLWWVFCSSLISCSFIFSYFIWFPWLYPIEEYPI